MSALASLVDSRLSLISERLKKRIEKDQKNKDEASQQYNETNKTIMTGLNVLKTLTMIKHSPAVEIVDNH